MKGISKESAVPVAIRGRTAVSFVDEERIKVVDKILAEFEKYNNYFGGKMLNKL